MTIVWSDGALRDRDHILTVISEDSPTAAIKLDQSFENAAKDLLVYPLKGRAGRKPGTRELIVHPNYIVIYVPDMPDDGDIYIVTVAHAARRWP